VGGVIQIAQPVRWREALARHAALRIAIPLLLLLPLLGGAAAWMRQQQSRTAAPHRGPSAAAAMCHAGSYAQSRATGNRAADRCLNHLLLRLQAAFQAQRAFRADAAHELRSPLTAVACKRNCSTVAR